MSLIDITIALQNKLLGITPALATQWENSLYTPVQGTPYQRVFMMPGKPQNPSMGDAMRREVGFLQVNLMYPIDKGVGPAFARAELIQAAFYRGLSLNQNQTVVVISNTPSIGPGDTTDTGRYALPVKIPYFSNIMI